MNRGRRPPKTGAFRAYVAIPLAVASAAAVGMAVQAVLTGITGYDGKGSHTHTTVPVAEAWSTALDLAGVIFVVTFLVIAAWTKIRSRRNYWSSN